MSEDTRNETVDEPDSPEEPPIAELADVPPEEWEYSSGQALAGCGVVAAVVLAIILPIILGLFMDSPWSQIIGFGIPAILAIICVIWIGRLTADKRAERRAAMGETEADRN